MTFVEALEMIERGETPEQYKKRVNRIRRLANERYDIEDSLSVLDGSDPRDAEKIEKKQRRLAKVLAEIEALK